MTNIKTLQIPGFLLSTFVLFAGCTSKLGSSTSLESSSTGATITSPSTSISSDNAASFPLSGNCPASESLSLKVSTITQAITCSASGTWSANLDLTTLADGALTIVVTSVTSGTQLASLQVTKSTAVANSCPGGATTFTTNMNARYVIGQADFVANSANRGGSAAANSLNAPIGITVANNKLYVADAGNNRVLVYNTLPTSNGVAADAVIGQSDFTSTASGTTATSLNGIQSIASDGTYLAVAEWSNSRVSLWPLANPTSASIILGQANATTSTVNTGGISASTMGAAAGIAFAAGKFFVGDVSNARALTFSTTGLVTGKDANSVIGQLNFTSSTIGSGATGFGQPYGIASDGTHLAIVDNYNDRLMIYNSIPSGNGGTADVTWGGWGVTSTNLNSPVGVAMGGGKMFIADRSSDRVLVFNSIPTSASQAADVVLGQTNFTGSDHNQCACTTAAANTLWGVHHVYWDGCRLYVTDRQNNRVLVY